MITVKLKGLAPQRFESVPEAMQFCMAHVQMHSSLVISAIKKLADLENFSFSSGAVTVHLEVDFPMSEQLQLAARLAKQEGMDLIDTDEGPQIRDYLAPNTGKHEVYSLWQPHRALEQTLELAQLLKMTLDFEKLCVRHTDGQGNVFEESFGEQAAQSMPFAIVRMAARKAQTLAELETL